MSVVQSCFFQLRNIAKIKSSISFYSHLDYCNSLYSWLSQKATSRLQLVFLLVLTMFFVLFFKMMFYSSSLLCNPVIEKCYTNKVYYYYYYYLIVCVHVHAHAPLTVYVLSVMVCIS